VTTQNKNTVVKGSDISLSVFLQTKDCNGVILPYNLTGKTVEVVYRNGSGALVTLTNPAVQVLDPVYSNISISLSETDTENLKTGFFDFDVIITQGGDTKIWKFEKQITVVDRIR
jgi:hypothetical protein